VVRPNHPLKQVRHCHPATARRHNGGQLNRQQNLRKNNNKNSFKI
jgi:hypothetical protein